MITPEQLISDLKNQISKLEEELATTQQDIKDFEVLAIEWKKSYSSMERNYKIRLSNAQQTIEGLEQELEDFKKYFNSN